MNGSERESNEELRLAREYVEHTSVNIFLTGKAGTGKTTFLRSVVDSVPKRKIVLAPTGVAAINAGGVTIHSFFQLPLGLFLPEYTISTAGQPDRFTYNKTKLTIIRSLELIIIDEVSMLRADILDRMDEILRRLRRRSEPFGGIQMLMIGDMQQLPPVVNEQEWQIMHKYYPSPYFFDSRALVQSRYVTVELRKIYRQSDSRFIDLLAKVRDNRMDSAALDLLNSRYRPDFEPQTGDGYIILCTHNQAANSVNSARMARLAGPEFRFEARIDGDFPENMYPQEHELVLRLGAQVIFTKNDPSPQKAYVNGSLGVVTALEEDDIEVTLFDGTEIEVERAEWEHLKYEIDSLSKEIKTSIEGLFVQYPLRLAWAITVHKSQGLTFDKAVIDAGRSFTHGQVYVALSRCRSLEGIVLRSVIGDQAIISDRKIEHFNQWSATCHPNEEQLRDDKRAFFMQTLTELFEFASIEKEYYAWLRMAGESLSTTYPKLIGQWNDIRRAFGTEVTDVAVRFVRSLERLVSDDYASNGYLHERIAKASGYFYDTMCRLFIPLLGPTASIEIDNKQIKSLYNSAFTPLLHSLVIKMKLYRILQSEEFELEKYIRLHAETIVECEQLRMKRVVKLVDDSPDKVAPKPDEAERSELPETDVLHPELMAALVAWRLEQSREHGVRAYQIAHQKALIGVANARPATLDELEAIKGVGKMFVRRYGPEVLEIVASCDK